MAYIKKLNKSDKTIYQICEVKAIPFRETKTPLVYIPKGIEQKETPKKGNDPDLSYIGQDNVNTALYIHEWLWNRLTSDHRRELTGKWIGEAIGELFKATKWILSPLGDFKPLPAYKADETLEKHLIRLGSPEYILSNKEQSKQARDIAKALEAPKPTDIGKVIADYVADRAGKLARKFPGYEKDIEGVKGLIREVLATGTLMEDSKKRIPKPLYQAFRSRLSDRDVAKLSIKVGKVQTFRLWGIYLADYLKGSISSIADLKADHVAGYQDWRDSHRGDPSKVKEDQEAKNYPPIAIETLKGELAFFKGLYSYAVTQELTPSHRMGSIDSIQPREGNQTEKEDEKPLDIKLLVELIADARSDYLNCPEGTDREKDWKVAKKQNWLALIALSITGCRPDEINTWKLNKDNDLLLIQGTKTTTAKRNFPIGPTLATVLKDKDFKGINGDIARRLNQWIERLGNRLAKDGKGNKYANVTPYRLRHTVATVLVYLYPAHLALIAEQLGHTNPKFTKARYTNLTAFLHLNREELKEFWTWLNKDYFDKPSRTSFRSSRKVKEEAFTLY